MDNSYKGSLWSAVFALAAGLFMVVWPDITLEKVVLIVGILFIASAVFNLAFALSRRKGSKSSSSLMGLVASFGAAVLGIVMVVNPIGIVNVFIYIIAAAIILLGLYEICAMAFMFRPISFPFGFFILPSLLVVCGVIVCILGAEKVGQLMVMVTGISLMVYAVSTFINIVGLVSYRRSLKKRIMELQS